MLLPDDDHVARLSSALSDLMGDAPATRAALSARAHEVRSVYAQQTVMAQWDALFDAVTRSGK